ncbi:lipopolysaccharide transport system LptA/LptD domain protein [Leptospira broomii serovar Hurstbridge str. 5399]|uniref:Lipopolysaccharide transport system LptA/LptD domain protein n=1 Tax=Leptospira broomii serovar Hurstbridge str. 5399 TaxID=1049789 RepID=T0F745_9LEPT|nr:LptA/OstA family protein [Leptospira broomii]EQA43342.1 lipopolysaccharide transport system LptA/LptD domain protein [Leptospira broomii serovar Hurstbridge str. 5399]
MKNRLCSFLFIFALLFVDDLFPHIRPPLLFSPESLERKPIQGIGESDPTKKESFPTYWGGSTLTQEDKQIQGLKVTTFTLEGGAWIQHKKVKLSANRIEVIGKEAYKAFLKYGVEVDDQENGTTLKAGTGEYDKYAEIVIIKDRPRLFFKDKTGKTTIIAAQTIERQLSTKITKLIGGVIITHPDVTILCKEALFKESENVITTDPNPFLLSKDRYLTGTKLSFYTSENRILLEQNTVLFQTSYEKRQTEEGKETTEKVITILKGDRLESSNDENKERVISLKGNSTIFRKNVKITADVLESLGTDSHTIRGRRNVRIHDRENYLILSGNVLDYFRKEEYMHVTDDGKMEFLDSKSGAVTTTMTAQEFERFLDKDETVIRGNVFIKAKGSQAMGEYATYYEKDETIYLEGNPRIDRSGKILRAGKILFYPREGRAILTEGVHLGN